MISTSETAHGDWTVPRSHEDEACSAQTATAREELAPLPDGTLRRRGLRQALEDEWVSVAQADSLRALSDVRANASVGTCVRVLSFH